VADLRERGTSFLTEFSHSALKSDAIGPAIGAIFLLGFGTLVSPVDGMGIGSSELTFAAVDFFHQYLLRVPDTFAVVSSLAPVQGMGNSAPEFGVIIAAMAFTLAALLFLVVKGINSNDETSCGQHGDGCA